MKIPSNVKTIIESFVGNGDLLKFIKNKTNYNIKCLSGRHYTIKLFIINQKS